MKQIFTFLVCILSMHSFTNAQSRYDRVSVLLTEFRNTKADTNLIDSINRLSCELIDADSFEHEPAIIDSQYHLAQKLNYNYGLISALWLYTYYYNKCRKDYSTASAYLKTAVKIIDENHMDFDERVEEMVHDRILNHFFLVGDFAFAMKMVTNRLALYEQAKDTPMAAHYNDLIGFIFLRQNRTAESKKYYRKYLDVSIALKDSICWADACNCMADVFVEEKKYDSALIYCFYALHVYNTSNLRPKIRQVSYTRILSIAYTNFKIGNIYRLKGDYNKALRFSLYAVNLTKSGNPYDIAAYYINTGAIYKDLKNYNQALRYLDTGLAISKRIEHAEDIRDALRYKAETFSMVNRYDSAYYYTVLYNYLKDSISNEKINGEIERVNKEYETEKKDNQILLLNQENELRETTITRQIFTRNITIAGTILIFILLAVLYNSRQLRQKHKFQKELNNQKNELFNAIITTQEQERKRIAQDLHDSLGTVLSASKLKLSELGTEFQNDGPQKEKYLSALHLLDEAAKELRNISHNIMPASLAKIGLVAALKSVFENISANPELEITFSVYSMEERLKETTELSIYRIILELVNNVLKHAGATAIIVQLVRHPDSINITVEDNGVGFDNKPESFPHDGIGLNNIASRVEYLHGTFDIDTGKGKGTTIIINIPYG